MKKSNIYAPGNPRKINPNWFTGKTSMKDISGIIKSEQHNIYHVYFKGGSKTKLHTHNGNQILIATKGKGKLELFKKLQNKKSHFAIKKTESIPLTEGDVVYIPKNTLHTHGSISKTTTFSHIAINIISPKSSEYKTTWYESDYTKSAGNIVP